MLSGNNEFFCLEIVYHSYLWAGGQAGRISGLAAWLAGRSSERGGAGRGAQNGDETFWRVANVDALGTCRQICVLFVGKKWSMSGNSGRCRKTVDVVGE
jgi:hypothetical protein